MVLSLFTLVCLGAPMPGDVESARFKAYFERGETLYQQGDYGAAIWNFRRADAQRVTPEVAYDLAKSFEKLGDVPFTLYYYRLYMRRAPNATDTLEIAERVGLALSKAEGEGRGLVELDAPRATWVTVNGKKFIEPPAALFLPPGEYDVEAEFPSGVKKMVVQVRTGKTTNVSFEPARPPMVSAESALPADAVARGETGPQQPSNAKRTAAYVLAGVGVAALVTGAILGGMSNSDAQATANKSLTISQAQALADSANGKAIGANVLFGVGGAAVAGGAILFVISMPEPGMKSGGAR